VTFRYGEVGDVENLDGSTSNKTMTARERTEELLNCIEEGTGIDAGTLIAGALALLTAGYCLGCMCGCCSASDSGGKKARHNTVVPVGNLDAAQPSKYAQIMKKHSLGSRAFVLATSMEGKHEEDSDTDLSDDPMFDDVPGGTAARDALRKGRPGWREKRAKLRAEHEARLRAKETALSGAVDGAHDALNKRDAALFAQSMQRDAEDAAADWAAMNGSEKERQKARLRERQRRKAERRAREAEDRPSFAEASDTETDVSDDPAFDNLNEQEKQALRRDPRRWREERRKARLAHELMMREKEAARAAAVGQAVDEHGRRLAATDAEAIADAYAEEGQARDASREAARERARQRQEARLAAKKAAAELEALSGKKRLSREELRRKRELAQAMHDADAKEAQLAREEHLAQSAERAERAEHEDQAGQMRRSHGVESAALARDVDDARARAKRMQEEKRRRKAAKRAERQAAAQRDADRLAMLDDIAALPAEPRVTASEEAYIDYVRSCLAEGAEPKPFSAWALPMKVGVIALGEPLPQELLQAGVGGGAAGAQAAGPPTRRVFGRGARRFGALVRKERERDRHHTQVRVMEREFNKETEQHLSSLEADRLRQRERMKRRRMKRRHKRDEGRHRVKRVEDDFHASQADKDKRLDAGREEARQKALARRRRKHTQRQRAAAEPARPEGPASRAGSKPPPPSDAEPTDGDGLSPAQRHRQKMLDMHARRRQSALARRQALKAEQERRRRENPNAVPEKGLLSAACGKGDWRSVRKLLRKGADPDERDKKLSAPLHHCSWGPTKNMPCSAPVEGQANHFVCMLLLLRAGADITAKNLRKNTPMHLMMERDHEAIIDYLLENVPEAASTLRAKNTLGKRATDVTSLRFYDSYASKGKVGAPSRAQEGAEVADAI
jgi:hypothetical protein